MKKIGFIGTGKMAEAILKSLLQKHASENILGIEINKERKTYIQNTYNIAFPSNDLFFQQCDIIVLSIKPQNLEQALSEYQNLWRKNSEQIIISIIAGIPSYMILDSVPESCQVVRVMPNTPALIGQGAAGISFPENFSQENQQLILDLLSGLGETIIVPEHQMNAVTALSGSGPAYVYTFIQSLIDGGVLMGLTRDQATKLTLQTILGSTAMVQETKRNPMDLRGDVTSPGGTTIFGIKVMEENGFSGIMLNAIEAAANRAHELESHSH